MNSAVYDFRAEELRCDACGEKKPLAMFSDSASCEARSAWSHEVVAFRDAHVGCKGAA